MLVQLGTFRLHSSNSLDERGLSACLCCLLSCSAGSCVTKVFGLETPPKEPAVKMSKRSFTKLEKQSMVSLRCSCFISLLFLQWSSRLHTSGRHTALWTCVTILWYVCHVCIWMCVFVTWTPGRCLRHYLAERPGRNKFIKRNKFTLKSLKLKRVQGKSPPPPVATTDTSLKGKRKPSITIADKVYIVKLAPCRPHKHGADSICSQFVYVHTLLVASIYTRVGGNVFLCCRRRIV